MKKVFIFVFLVIFIFKMYSEEYLITANRIKQSEENLSENVKFVDREELDKMGFSELNDVMKNLSYIYVPEYSPLSASSIKFQGSGGENVLFMIDGVMLNDPSGINRSYGISNLALNSVESIEIVSGSESALYGSNSNTGVVNIKTADSKIDHLNLKLEGGSFNTYSTGISINKIINNYMFYLSGNYMNSKGYNISPKGSEKDGTSGTNLFAKVKYNSKYFDMKFGSNYIYEVIDYDSFTTMSEDSDNIQKTEKYLVYLKNSFKLTDIIDSDLNINFSENTRKNEEGSQESVYKGKYYTINLKNKIEINEKNSFLLGFDYYNEFAKQDTYFNMDMKEREFDSKELFAGIFSKISKTTDLNLVGRYSIPSKEAWESDFIYKAGINERIAVGSNLFRISCNYGIGINYPTLYQMYGKGYDYNTSSYYQAGNLNLEAEKSNNFTVSFKNIFLNGKFGLNYTFSLSEFDDYIQAVYDSSYHTTYENLEKVKNKSYSLDGFLNLFKTKNFNLKLLGSYTHSTVNDITGDEKKRVPMVPSYKYRFQIDTRYKDLGLVLIKTTVGDKQSAYPEMKVDPYSLLNANLKYSIGKNLDLGLKLNNILDIEYEQTVEEGTDYYGNSVMNIIDTDGYVHYPGYRTPGFNFRLSLNYKIPF
ncbi:MAG: TonB-dependent receptor plug domain-containing protein [Candidatus Mcinerneyibacterium aminivorans]|uniref:TonB-dependent receptor plug domain-containing protein n=1 Tax=Candidatus Mcinerneyibacterium aminivorans TaxID=2703815 RepID=A0A5D0ME40_9BACT|nr:MAG: TonB-dependent receptor plug domain-containing protein [Candidatus Mcinerneyibacterium aminivorans]